MKGYIALDIDGTLTADFDHLPDPVVEILHELHHKGYQLLFLTGRTWTLAAKTLATITFDYYFAIQNGADIIKMPSKTLLHRNYLDVEVVQAIETIYAGEKEDFIVYSGFEQGDFCYYRPQRFSARMLKYLAMLEKMTKTPWQKDFTFPQGSAFPLLKCFGSEKEVWRLFERLQALPVNATVIKDPLDPELHLILVTHPQANKGDALEYLVASFGEHKPIIAAGDDLNDVAMLNKAQIKIVMKTAPASMHAMADIVADSAKSLGIVGALKEATLRIEGV